MLRWWRLGMLVMLMALPLASVRGQEDADPTRIWIADSVPVTLLRGLVPLFGTEDYVWVTDLDDAHLALDYEQAPGDISAEWVYVPVVPFASTADNIRWPDIQAYWAGDLAALRGLTPDGTAPAFVASNETYRAMLSLLGTPDPSVPLRFVGGSEAIPDELWATRPYGWGIMGFETLVPQVKVLALDQYDVFGDDFIPADYPLTATINLKGDGDRLARAADDLAAQDTWPARNRNPARLGRVVLSGVTALTRATAFKMEELGLTRPADGIMEFIADAHIIHTSNEVAFTENCGPPDPFSGSVIFCSQPEYLELLLHMGVNVVELTGNHVNDYGPGALRYSLGLYEENAMGFYGGGYDPEDARDALIVEANGNTVAFIGCNVPGPIGAWATETRVGAAECDNDYLAQELPRLADTVDVVVMSVQEFEYYRYSVGVGQLRRFQLYANWGADVVIGSQAHQPQGFTFHQGSFLHHGLGNLFFDQMQEIGTRQMFIDKLILHEGRVISVVLYTGLIEDFCCPRPMTAFERANFLDTIFQASGW
ncbi:MAG: CapA family protein [Anaerolineales bacterium]